MLFHYRDRFHEEVVDEDGRRPPLGVAVMVLVVFQSVFLEFLGLNRKGWQGSFLGSFEGLVFLLLVCLCSVA